MTRFEVQTKFQGMGIPTSAQNLTNAQGFWEGVAVDRAYWGNISDFPSLRGIPQPIYSEGFALWTDQNCPPAPNQSDGNDSSDGTPQTDSVPPSPQPSEDVPNSDEGVSA